MQEQVTAYAVELEMSGTTFSHEFTRLILEQLFLNIVQRVNYNLMATIGKGSIIILLAVLTFSLFRK